MGMMLSKSDRKKKMQSKPELKPDQKIGFNVATGSDSFMTDLISWDNHILMKFLNGDTWG